LIIWKMQYRNKCFQFPQKLCKPYYGLSSFNFDRKSHREEDTCFTIRPVFPMCKVFLMQKINNVCIYYFNFMTK
jgi:hypothetical protein